MTRSERSLIVYKIMSETWYGEKIDEFGLEQMIKSKIILAGYPLHEDSWKWPKSGLISDRQVRL